MAGCMPHTSSNWGGPSARPQISSGFWTQFWGPPAQCVSPGFSAKSQNRSAASPAPPRRSAPTELQTKAVWPNVRGVIFVARDTGIQGPYSATPPGAKNCLCRDLSRAAGGLVSRFDKRFQAFRALLRPLSKPCFQGFEASRGLSRPVRGLGFCANHTVAQHI